VLDMQHREYELVCWGSNKNIDADNAYDREWHNYLVEVASDIKW
jgi:hypothetical protein